MILNIVNFKYYIGSSNNIQRRWRNHKVELNANRHCNPYLQSAWNKYGSDKFEFNVIEYLNNESEIVEKEQIYINKTNCLSPKGYNSKPLAGSNFGWIPTIETRRKMSDSHKGKRTQPIGYKHSNETILKLKNKRKNKTPSRKIEKWPHLNGCKCQCDECRKKVTIQKREYEAERRNNARRL